MSEALTRVPPSPWRRSPRTTCGNCGQSMPKAKRVFHGVGYCGTCYASQFRRMPCRQCGAPTRLHVREYGGLCRACTKEARRCLRCTRPVPHAALMVQGRPVCPSCRRYFKPPSTWKPIGHETCRVCRRHREVAGRDGDGKALCGACVGRDRSQEIRARDEAYWSASLERRLDVAASRLERAWCADLLRDFIRSERERVGPKPIALRLAKYVECFVLFDHAFASPEDLRERGYAEILTVDQQRRFGVFLIHLARRGIPIPSQSDRHDAAERMRIAALADEAARLPQSEMLQAFISDVANRARKGEIELHSARQVVRVAVDVMRIAGAQPLRQTHVDAYLTSCPGQRGNLSAFLGWMRRRGSDVRLSSGPGSPKSFTKPPPSAFDAMRSAALGEALGAAAAGVAGLVVSVTGITLKEVLNLPRKSVSRRRRRWTLLGGVMLDARLDAPMESFLALRDRLRSDSQHLFPGRLPGHGMSQSAVARYFKAWGVPIRTLGVRSRRALRTRYRVRA